MKRKTTLLWLSAAAAAALLPSCVDTYAAPGPGYYGGGYSSGTFVETLPPRYVTESYGGVRYYNYNGVYYRPHNHGYVIVERPYGAPVYRGPAPVYHGGGPVYHGGGPVRPVPPVVRPVPGRPLPPRPVVTPRPPVGQPRPPYVKPGTPGNRPKNPAWKKPYPEHI